MKLIQEHINEKFEEEGDPIIDLGIGPVSYFKNFLTLFAEEDKQYLFYSFTIFDNYIYFHGYTNNINVKLKGVNKVEYLYDYLNEIIDKLGFSKILKNPKISYFPENRKKYKDVYVIFYQMIPEISNVFKTGNYRKHVDNEFKFYQYPQYSFYEQLQLLDKYLVKF